MPLGSSPGTPKRRSNGDPTLTGPESPTYDQVAELISNTSGLPVMHQRPTEDELAARFQNIGIASVYAQTLAAMDTVIAAGAEDCVTDYVRTITGRPPADFATFAQGTRRAWSEP